MMRIGIAADHGGFELKVQLTAALKAAGYEVADFGAHELVSGNEENGGQRLVIYVSGKLEKADYEHLVPEFDRLVRQQGKLRVLFDMSAFQ